MTTPYPKYYAVNDRPVKLVALPTGEVDALVFDFVTGGFVPDRSYFARVMAHGHDIDALDAAAFERRVAELRRIASETRQATPLVFSATGDGEVPYVTEHEGRTLRVRVNDFPAEPLYTLLVDGIEIEDLEDWPGRWVKEPRPK